MKKFVLILGLLLSLSAKVWADELYQIKNDVAPNLNNVQVQKTHSAKEQEFVNPIFYQPLRPMSKHSGYVYLTPISIKFMTPLDKNLIDSQGQCNLLENQKKFIKLLCNTSWQMLENGRMVTNTSEDIYTYEIKGIFSNTCLEVEEVVYEITKRGNEKISTSFYCISPSGSLSEFD